MQNFFPQQQYSTDFIKIQVRYKKNIYYLIIYFLAPNVIHAQVDSEVDQMLCVDG